MKRIIAVTISLALLVPTGLIIASPAMSNAKPTHLSTKFHRSYVPSPCAAYSFNQTEMRACVNRYWMEYTHLSKWEHNCLAAAIGTTFGVVLGGWIGAIAGRSMAAAVIGGGAGGCLTAFINS